MGLTMPGYSKHCQGFAVQAGEKLRSHLPSYHHTQTLSYLTSLHSLNSRVLDSHTEECLSTVQKSGFRSSVSNESCFESQLKDAGLA